MVYIFIQATANITLIFLVIFFLFIWKRSALGNAYTKIYPQYTIYALFGTSILKMYDLHDILIDDTVECSPIFFKAILFSPLKYGAFNFINNFSIVQFLFSKKCKHLITAIGVL